MGSWLRLVRRRALGRGPPRSCDGPRMVTSRGAKSTGSRGRAGARSARGRTPGSRRRRKTVGIVPRGGLTTRAGMSPWITVEAPGRAVGCRTYAPPVHVFSVSQARPAQRARGQRIVTRPLETQKPGPQREPAQTRQRRGGDPAAPQGSNSPLTGSRSWPASAGPCAAIACEPRLAGRPGTVRRVRGPRTRAVPRKRTHGTAS
jgi:hypothetical protein